VALRVYPGGDSYFGAMVNSWIHVMMYSYYTFSLLKIRCPWKKYLTMAQLVQFTTVLAYSMWSFTKMPADYDWKKYLAYVVQDFEMASLFVLFVHFYRKAYSKKKKDAAALKLAEPSTANAENDMVAEQASVSSASSEEDVDDQSK
jgi:elongation of very long chain fatty acids protein 4